MHVDDLANLEGQRVILELDLRVALVAQEILDVCLHGVGLVASQLLALERQGDEQAAALDRGTDSGQQSGNNPALRSGVSVGEDGQTLGLDLAGEILGGGEGSEGLVVGVGLGESHVAFLLKVV